MTSALHMAALLGETVTEGHARICAERGHATAVGVSGWDRDVCPRCGDVIRTAQEAEAERVITKLDTAERLLTDPELYGLSRIGCTYAALPRRIAELRAQIAVV